jgi:predicted Zn-dependent protease
LIALLIFDRYLTMKKYINIITLASVVFLLVHLTMTPVVHSITIQEEETLSKEFLRVIEKQFHLIKDPFVVGYVNKIGRNILAVLPDQPFKYRFYVVKQHVYNAFATPAGHIFINSGLLEALESEEELAGILAHEIAHVVSRHISQNVDRSPKIGLATLAGVAAGIFMGVGGAAALGNAVVVGSMAAGQTASLAFSREDELQADQLALGYLNRAGYSSKGLLTSLQIMRSKQWFGSDQVPDYLLTHPASEERMGYIDTHLASNQLPKSKQRHIDKDEYRFVRATVSGKYSDGKNALARFDSQLKTRPGDSIALYGKALALAQIGDHEKAVTLLKKALEKNALNPVMLKELGRIYFIDGQYPKALQTLEGSVGLAPEDSESLFYLSRTQMELGNLDNAADGFHTILKRNQKDTEVYLFLGNIYGMQENLGEAHYYLGKYHKLKGRWKTAIVHLEKALPLVSDPMQKEEIERMLKQIKKIAKREELNKEE